MFFFSANPPPYCGPNEELSFTPLLCQPTCANTSTSNLEYCGRTQEISCACREGFVRARPGGVCVPMRNCPDSMSLVSNEKRHV